MNILYAIPHLHHYAAYPFFHKGFMDGISSPAIKSLTGQLPGQIDVPPGILVCGEDGDDQKDSRPAWAKNGSFLVFVSFTPLRISKLSMTAPSSFNTATAT